jgi:simple sugar transport system ATP-binding protein
MDEVIKLCDGLTILRQGKNVFGGRVSEVTINQLREYIVGKELESCENTTNVYQLENNPVVLEVKNLKVKGDMGHTAVNDASLKVRKGEIIGIAGESGNGQKELAEAIYGLRKIESGQLLIWNEPIEHPTAKDMFQKGVHYIPEEKFLRGGCSSFSIADNSIINRYQYKPFASRKMIKRTERDDFALEIVEKFDVRAESCNKPLRHLSGGNIQKLISGREIMGNFDVLLAFHPTAGLDIKATANIHKSILNLKQEGKAVMLFDEDLNEILALSDRIVVMSKGKIIGEKNRCDTTLLQLGSIIAGI